MKILVLLVLFAIFIIFLSIISLLILNKKINVTAKVVFFMIISSLLFMSLSAVLIIKNSNRAINHTYVINYTTYYIPLPSKTVFKYRTSNTSAVYSTKSGLNDVISLYERIAQKESFNKMYTNNGSVILKFKYNGYNFDVRIDKNLTIFIHVNENGTNENLKHKGTADC